MKIGAALTSTLKTSPVFVTNGRLVYEESEWSLASPPVGYIVLYCDGTALSVLSRGVVDRVFRDEVERCAAPQNPGGAIPRGGSSDRSGGCLELREEWRMHHTDVLSIFHQNLGG